MAPSPALRERVNELSEVATALMVMYLTLSSILSSEFNSMDGRNEYFSRPCIADFVRSLLPDEKVLEIIEEEAIVIAPVYEERIISLTEPGGKMVLTHSGTAGMTVFPAPGPGFLHSFSFNLVNADIPKFLS